jgi:hypothetical protein
MADGQWLVVATNRQPSSESRNAMIRTTRHEVSTKGQGDAYDLTASSLLVNSCREAQASD